MYGNGDMRPSATKTPKPKESEERGKNATAGERAGVQMTKLENVGTKHMVSQHHRGDEEKEGPDPDVYVSKQAFAITTAVKSIESFGFLNYLGRIRWQYYRGKQGKVKNSKEKAKAKQRSEETRNRKPWYCALCASK